MNKDRTVRKPRSKTKCPIVEKVSKSRMTVKLSTRAKPVKMTRSEAKTFAAYLLRFVKNMTGKKIKKS